MLFLYYHKIKMETPYFDASWNKNKFIEIISLILDRFESIGFNCKTLCLQYAYILGISFLEISIYECILLKLWITQLHITSIFIVSHIS